MSDNILGEVFQPDHCQVSVSPDKGRLALTFRSKDRGPLTIVLPIPGVASLQRKLAHTLYLLGVRQVPNEASPESQPAPAAAV